MADKKFGMAVLAGILVALGGGLGATQSNGVLAGAVTAAVGLGVVLVIAASLRRGRA